MRNRIMIFNFFLRKVFLENLQSMRGYPITKYNSRIIRFIFIRNFSYFLLFFTWEIKNRSNFFIRIIVVGGETGPPSYTRCWSERIRSHIGTEIRSELPREAAVGNLEQQSKDWFSYIAWGICKILLSILPIIAASFIILGSGSYYLIYFICNFKSFLIIRSYWEI